MPLHFVTENRKNPNKESFVCIKQKEMLPYGIAYICTCVTNMTHFSVSVEFY